MRFFLKVLAAGVFVLASSGVQASSAPASDTTPQMAYEDISRSLPELEPITFQASAEKHKLLVFVDNQCIYCSYVVKNIKKYTDAGLTMSFLTVVPISIKDSVIEDMGRVWCASDRQKSLQNAMAGFLPGNDSSEKCKNLVIKQSDLADRLGVTVTPVMVVLDRSVHTFIGSVSPEKILSELQ
ncbi:MAG: thioredoxin fold domain-containing protein [Klebsiella sp.]|uniref:thioredoxin fold domain-containing protein n=1 Tax=Klebsiella variicola TaxID=244366 RepID=UPI0028FEA5E9|nr:thioredoxin fold domain-containing protein [Klebsiella sp.]MDU2306389.1 thioredoxin fold domain-containing protein [Klebsiella sp.]HCA9948968.1 thioredoxin fold domain-containing protein [Klebsiella variicola subsp. variicola]